MGHPTACTVKYRRMARMCGYWATGRNLEKRGYTLHQALEILFGRHWVR